MIIKRQKNFSNKNEQREKKNKTEKALVAGTVTAGVGTTGIGFAQKSEAKKLKKIQEDVVPSAERIAEKRGLKIGPGLFGLEFQDPEYISKRAALEEKKAKAKTAEAKRNIDKEILDEFSKSKKRTIEAAEEHTKYVSKLQKAGEKSAKKIEKLGKAGKIGLGVTAAGMIATTGYKLHKAAKKKDDKK